MKLELKARSPQGGWPEGFIEWDPDTGDVQTDNPEIMELINLMAETAKKYGFIETWPFDTAIPWRDPFKNIVEFTALIGFIWYPPPELKEYYPVYEEQEYPKGAIIA